VIYPTPGPWRTSPRGPSELQHVTAPCGKSIAQVWDYSEAEDNARLIAAAPELLDRLLALCKTLRIHHWGYSGFECHSQEHKDAEALLIKIGAVQ
jgi:hypothetical protein